MQHKKSLTFCVQYIDIRPVAVLTFSKFITYLTPYNNALWNSISLKKLIIIMWALIAEELGWRGYLQEKIEERYHAISAPIVVGLIWSAWHFHFFLSGSMDFPIILFVIGCIIESYGYYVITKIAKGNIIPASLWHFSGNLFFNIYRFNPNWNDGSIMPYMIVNAMYLMYMIAFLVWNTQKIKIKPES